MICRIEFILSIRIFIRATSRSILHTSKSNFLYISKSGSYRFSNKIKLVNYISLVENCEIHTENFVAIAIFL